MRTNRLPQTSFAMGIALVLATAGAMSAQTASVVLGEGTVEIFDTDGDSAVLIDNGADYTAGGEGRSANLNLRGSDGPTTLFYNAFQAELILGGGTHEGLLLLKDDDGLTTTIDLDGRTGLIELGGVGEDGDLTVHDATDAVTIRLNGAAGTVTNSLDGNGLVKAWARIRQDGTTESCWRCTASSYSAPFGDYTITFSVDIGDRPKSATGETVLGEFPLDPGVLTVHSTAANNVVVRSRDLDGLIAARPFSLVIY